MMLFDDSVSRFRDKVLLSGFLMVVLLGFGVFVSIIAFSILNNTSLDHVSGAWIAIAMDLRDGVFYRPLFDASTGFGGTRFFPLFFSLVAMAAAAFDSSVVAGHVVSVSSGVLLLIACYLFLRRLDVKPVFAVAICALLLTSVSIRFGFEVVRGDILPLALNVLGLVVYMGRQPGRSSLYLAVLLFVLAFATKMTAIHGVASLFVWLLLTGRGREGLHILLATFAGYAAFLGLLYFGTAGRVYDIFQACASGGANIVTILKAPIKFTASMSGKDQGSMILLFWATIVFFYRFKDLGKSLPSVYLLVTLMLTVLLYGSPGIEFNHLVDISVASVLFVGYAGFRARSPDMRPSAAIYVTLMMFTILKSLWMVNDGVADYKQAKMKFPEQLTDLVMQQEGIILSEDPLLPVYLNKKPYLLDPFMLRLAMQNDEAIRTSVVNDINSRKYSAIIFIKDPVDKKDWYSDLHFGKDFVANVLDNYQETSKVGEYVIYQPR